MILRSVFFSFSDCKNIDEKMLKLCCNLYENTSIISEKMYALNPSGGNRPTGNAGRRSAPWRPALGLALTRLHQRFFSLPPTDEGRVLLRPPKPQRQLGSIILIYSCFFGRRILLYYLIELQLRRRRLMVHICCSQVYASDLRSQQRVQRGRNRGPQVE